MIVEFYPFNLGAMVNDANIDALTPNPKYRYEVADEYGISVRTLNRWIDRANLDIPNGLIDPYHLKIIYKTFGTPKNLK